MHVWYDFTGFGALIWTKLRSLLSCVCCSVPSEQTSLSVWVILSFSGIYHKNRRFSSESLLFISSSETSNSFPFHINIWRAISTVASWHQFFVFQNTGKKALRQYYAPSEGTISTGTNHPWSGWILVCRKFGCSPKTGRCNFGVGNHHQQLCERMKSIPPSWKILSSSAPLTFQNFLRDITNSFLLASNCGSFKPDKILEIFTWEVFRYALEILSCKSPARLKLPKKFGYAIHNELWNEKYNISWRIIKLLRKQSGIRGDNRSFNCEDNLAPKKLSNDPQPCRL